MSDMNLCNLMEKIMEYHMYIKIFIEKIIVQEKLLKMACYNVNVVHVEIGMVVLTNTFNYINVINVKNKMKLYVIDYQNK